MGENHLVLLKRNWRLINIGLLLNEREYAEKALRECKMGRKPSKTLGILIKYYTSQGYSKEKVRRLIEDFMLRCNPDINLVKWQSSLDRWIPYFSAKKLIEIDYIEITEAELETCRMQKTRVTQQVTFTLICLAKYFDIIDGVNGGWVNCPEIEIFKSACYQINSMRRSLLFNDLKNLGLISFASRVNNINIKVECIDRDSPVALKITDLRNLGLQFRKAIGESYMECTSCGLTIKQMHHTQKYCPTCAREVNIKKTIDNFKSRNAQI